MVSKFDLKINSLEKEKSELDISFLQSQKDENIEKIYSLLDEWDMGDEDAASKLREIRWYRKNIKEIDYKMVNRDQLLENIDNKISSCRDRKEKVANIPLQRDTKEAIAETFWWDVVYEYAKEIWDEELVEKLENRSLSPRKYMNILEKDYRKYKSDLYESLFSWVSINENPSSEKTAKKKLPNWMIEQIRKELKDNKYLSVDEIESFLKNELKKNWWIIRASHIKNIFPKNYVEALKYITSLIIYYSEFSFVNNLVEKDSGNKKKQKNKKLISTVSGEEVENNRVDRLETEKKLARLFEIKSFDNLDDRIPQYVDFLIELWYKFSDRKVFEIELKDAIISHTGYRIEKDIQKILAFLINWNDCYEKVWVYNYYVFKLNCSRRIMWYPNWEIYKICPHAEYDNIRDCVKPPKDKLK